MAVLLQVAEGVKLLQYVVDGSHYALFLPQLLCIHKAVKGVMPRQVIA